MRRRQGLAFWPKFAHVAMRGSGAHPDGMKPDLRAELLRRAERDQAARQTKDADTFEQVDADNLPWLKKVVAEVGWPGRSDVGEDGTHAAWLLAQHADRDPAFQRECLELLSVAADHGEAAQADMAYLTDRVLLAEGRPQEFGTQATARNGRWLARHLRDPGGVDERRAAMSLGPLAEYLAGFSEVYGPPVPPATSCGGCGSKVEFWLPDPGEEAKVECANCGLTITITLHPPAGVPGLGHDH